MRCNRGISKKRESIIENGPPSIKNLIMIGAAYVFSGLNCFFAGITSEYRSLIMGGVVLLLVAPVCLLDKRKDMRGTLGCVASCIVFFLFSAFISWAVSFWWIVVCSCEVFFCALIILIMRMKTGDGSMS